MVARMRTLLFITTVALALAGCDLFSNPFPGFLGGVEETVVVDVDSILPGGRIENGTGYDLEVIGSGADRRLLLLVEPPTNDPATFSYDGRLIVMDLDLQEEIRLEAATSIDYLSRPFGYGHDGSLLAGYSVYQLPLSGAAPDHVTEPPHGLQGFITIDAVPATRLFATPSGRFSAFHLQIESYQFPFPVPPGWAPIAADAETVEIVPNGLALSADPALAQDGYQLLGIGRNGGEIRFLLSRPSQQQIIGAAATLSEVVDAGLSPRPVLLPEGSDPLFTINADRPQASADDEGFFLMRRDGWFERYDWDGNLQSRVTGDTSFSRQYAFDVEGDQFFRYDPASATLSRIRGWW